MKQLKRYVINQNTVLITGKYNSYGKLCTIAIEGETAIIIDQSPLKVIIDTMHYYGRSVKGAIEGAKSILGEIKMCPFIVCEAKDLCLFPHKSPTHHDCIWFNHRHVLNTSRQGRFTIVELSNGRSVKIQTRLTSFNTKKQKAGDLRRIVSERSKSPMLLYIEPKKEYRQSKDSGMIEFEE